MCALARVLEAAGLATVALVSVRDVAERLPPPRALYCEFPLGRPLGRPNDPDFQHDVLRRAFALLDHASGPVLDDHPETIASDDTALACPVPARYDPSVPEAVDEARALRAAYDRTRQRRGTTSVGRAVDADGVPDAVAALARVAEGAPWKEAAIPGDPVLVSHDVRSYYEEAALSLADVTPGPGQVETWFYDHTAGGRALLAARAQMRDQGANPMMWIYMARATR